MVKDPRPWWRRMLKIHSPSLAMLGTCDCDRCVSFRHGYLEGYRQAADEAAIFGRTLDTATDPDRRESVRHRSHVGWFICDRSSQ